MAATFDSSNSLAGDDVSSFTFSLTVANQTNRCLFVGVGYRKNASQSVSSITFNGANLAKITEIGNSPAYAELWYLLNPAVATANVVVTMSAAVRGVAGAASFYNVDQLTAYTNATTATGSDPDLATVSVTSPATSLVLDIVSVYVGFLENHRMSVAAAQTEMLAAVGGQTTSFHEEVGMSRLVGAGGATAMPWTYDNPASVTREWCMIGISVDQVGTTSQSGTVTAEFPNLTASASGYMHPSGSAAAEFPNLTASATGHMPASGTAAPEFPNLTASVTGAVNVAVTGTAACTFPSVVCGASNATAIGLRHPGRIPPVASRLSAPVRRSDVPPVRRRNTL